MRIILYLVCLIWGLTLPVFAQVEVKVHPNQQALLASDDPQLSANKKLVYDFWVQVFQARNETLIPEMVTESYIQHNPNVPTGREAFARFVKSLPKPDGPPLKTIPNLVMLTAERDIVTLAFRVERIHPTEEGQKYTTTWFDMFRIEDGKIAEHWDPANIWQ